jgi:hypothetical protein
MMAAEIDLCHIDDIVSASNTQSTFSASRVPVRPLSGSEPCYLEILLCVESCPLHLLNACPKADSQGHSLLRGVADIALMGKTVSTD